MEFELEALNGLAQIELQQSLSGKSAEEASRLGEAFTRWQLANTRGIICRQVPGPASATPKAGQLISCTARGAPCGIVQSPGQLPKGAKPPAVRKKTIDI